MEEDVADNESQGKDIEDAYERIIAARIRPRGFERAVASYYDASDGPGRYCHLMGWIRDRKTVKAAHIVSKSLQSEELSCLFEVGEVELADPKNGMSEIFLMRW